MRLRDCEVINITGKKQSGKTTVATMLQYLILCRTTDEVTIPPTFTEWEEFDEHYRNFPGAHFGADTEIKSFAYKLKDMLRALLGCKLSDFESAEFKESEIPLYLNTLWPGAFKPHTVRELLQFVGTEIFRARSESFWVDALYSEWDEEDPKRWIVSDVRYPNEIVDEFKNFVIKVKRPHRPCGDTHPSELELDKIEEDLTILNAGTLKDLFNYLKSYVDENY